MVSSELDLSEIAIRQKIHFGCFGTVYKTFHRGFNRALRNVKINNKFRSDLGPVNQLKGLDHPNITRFYEIKINQSELNLITEYVDGSTLHTVIHAENKKPYSTAETRAWSWQITEALRYLHSNEILHKDLRPRNILVTADYKKIKLCDFGPIFDLRNELTGIEGSLPYMAPELFDCLPYTEKSDVYSLAITMWELLSRERPYNDVKVRIAIPYFVKMQGKRPRPLKDCPERIVSLLSKSWSTDPLNRPSIEEIQTEITKFPNCFNKFDDPCYKISPQSKNYETKKIISIRNSRNLLLNRLTMWESNLEKTQSQNLRQQNSKKIIVKHSDQCELECRNSTIVQYGKASNALIMEYIRNHTTHYLIYKEFGEASLHSVRSWLQQYIKRLLDLHKNNPRTFHHDQQLATTSTFSGFATLTIEEWKHEVLQVLQMLNGIASGNTQEFGIYNRALICYTLLKILASIDFTIQHPLPRKLVKEVLIVLGNCVTTLDCLMVDPLNGNPGKTASISFTLDILRSLHRGEVSNS